MGWLDATNSLEELQQLNDSSPNIKVLVIEGVDGGKLVSDNVLGDLDDYLLHFKNWYLSLPPTNEFPKPRKPLKRTPNTSPLSSPS